jgi:hypothetical protein
MICSKLVKDGEVVFFKGERGTQGKAVHDACRSDTGGDWYARDCATTYQRGRFGDWTLVTDHALQAEQVRLQMQRQMAAFAEENPELYDEQDG